MSKVYVLQQNIPMIEKGAEIKPLSALCYGIHDNERKIHVEWDKYFVENDDGTWFKLKEQNKEWEWTDELVAECHDYINKDTVGILTPFGVMKNIEYFKQSKSTPKGHQKDSIIEFRGFRYFGADGKPLDEFICFPESKYEAIKQAIENELNK